MQVGEGPPEPRSINVDDLSAVNREACFLIAGRMVLRFLGDQACL